MQRSIRVAYIGVLIVVGLFFLNACKRNYTPKPRGYFRIDLPQKQYSKFDTTFPYKFDYPSYTNIKKDRSKVSEKYWINIEFPELNGTIHISYKDVNNNISQIMEDTRDLAYKHTIKADAINEKIFMKPEKDVYGILYEIEGNAASSVQFFLTDSTDHYLRGALYFNTQPNKDSLAPVINFVKKDIIRLIESFEWK